MIQKFFVPGPLPGLNEIVDANKRIVKHLSRGRRRVYQYTLMKQEWGLRVSECLLEHRIKRVDQPIGLIYRWIEASRRRDPDNIQCGRKFVLDAMVHRGIIENDTQKWIKFNLDLPVEIDKKSPGVEVEFMPWDEMSLELIMDRYMI